MSAKGSTEEPLLAVATVEMEASTQDEVSNDVSNDESRLEPPKQLSRANEGCKLAQRRRFGWIMCLWIISTALGFVLGNLSLCYDGKISTWDIARCKQVSFWRRCGAILRIILVFSYPIVSCVTAAFVWTSSYKYYEPFWIWHKRDRLSKTFCGALLVATFVNVVVFDGWFATFEFVFLAIPIILHSTFFEFQLAHTYDLLKDPKVKLTYWASIIKTMPVYGMCNEQHPVFFCLFWLLYNLHILARWLLIGDTWVVAFAQALPMVYVSSVVIWRNYKIQSKFALNVDVVIHQTLGNYNDNNVPPHNDDNKCQVLKHMARCLNLQVFGYDFWKFLILTLSVDLIRVVIVIIQRE